ncbi:hypothetical protein V8E36_008818 [Tilletia maclaganii]
MPGRMEAVIKAKGLSDGYNLPRPSQGSNLPTFSQGSALAPTGAFTGGLALGVGSAFVLSRCAAPSSTAPAHKPRLSASSRAARSLPARCSPTRSPRPCRTISTSTMLSPAVDRWSCLWTARAGTSSSRAPSPRPSPAITTATAPRLQSSTPDPRHIYDGIGTSPQEQLAARTPRTPVAATRRLSRSTVVLPHMHALGLELEDSRFGPARIQLHSDAGRQQTNRPAVAPSASRESTRAEKDHVYTPPARQVAADRKRAERLSPPLLQPQRRDLDDAAPATGEDGGDRMAALHTGTPCRAGIEREGKRVQRIAERGQREVGQPYTEVGNLCQIDDIAGSSCTLHRHIPQQRRRAHAALDLTTRVKKQLATAMRRRRSSAGRSACGTFFNSSRAGQLLAMVSSAAPRADSAMTALGDVSMVAIRRWWTADVAARVQRVRLEAHTSTFDVNH